MELTTISQARVVRLLLMEQCKSSDPSELKVMANHCSKINLHGIMVRPLNHIFQTKPENSICLYLTIFV